MSNERRFKDVDTPSDIKPIGWYDPLQLINTASRVKESESFSHNSDRRVDFIEWEGSEVYPISFHLNEEPSKNQSEKPETQNDFYIGSHRKDSNAEGWRSELWIDFLADTGDGGNATYTIAKTLFQDYLSLTYHKDLSEDNPIKKISPKGLPKPLPRADLLVLGGDLVYPVANDEFYQTRFINFLIAALPKNISLKKKQEEEATRAVLSFPQNHDWYDNLSSFFLLFCHKEKKTFVDMKCPQRQSYAAVKLDFDWWLFGFDLALSDDIDEIQYLYFSKIIEQGELSKKSRIIITYKEPVWTLKALENLKYREHSYFYEKLEAQIEAKTEREIDIRLAGDQHYYRRYSKKELTPQSHLITCGSGGAFLHPTHGPKEFDQIDHIKPLDSVDNVFGRTYKFSEESKPTSEHHTQYEKKCDYPSSETSWNLSKRNFRFFTINPWFGIITALSYLFLVWANFSSLYGNFSTAKFDQGQYLCYKSKLWFDSSLNLFSNMSCAWNFWSWSSILAPINGIIGLFIIFGFSYFAQKFNAHAKIWAGIIGVLHGLTHFLAIFIIYFFILKYYIFLTYGFFLALIFLGVFLGYKVINKDTKTNTKLATFENIIGLIFYIIILGLFVYQISIPDLDFKPRDPMISPLEIVPFTITSVLVLTAGYFFGSSIMGGYLFVSLNLYKPNVLKIALILVFTTIWFVFSLWFNDCLMALTPSLLLFIFVFYIFKNRKYFGLERVPFIHSNEAFSSLRVEDYKGFLRFKITEERLEAYFIGIDKIPIEWKKSEQGHPKWEVKDKDKAIQPKLVDYWTVETKVNSDI